MTETSLKISEKKNKKNSSGLFSFFTSNIQFNLPTVKIVVRVPEKLASDIKLNTVMGDIFLENLRGNELYSKTVSGDIKLINSKFKVNQMSSTSGNIKSDSFAGIIEAKSVSGDLDIVLDDTYNAKNGMIKTVSGDISLKIADDMNLTVELKSVSGDISSKYEQMKDFGYGKKNAKVVIGDGRYLISVKSISGDVKIKNKDFAYK